MCLDIYDLYVHNLYLYIYILYINDKSEYSPVKLGSRGACAFLTSTPHARLSGFSPWSAPPWAHVKGMYICIYQFNIFMFTYQKVYIYIYTYIYKCVCVCLSVCILYIVHLIYMTNDSWYSWYMLLYIQIYTSQHQGTSPPFWRLSFIKPSSESWPMGTR